ncbi:hypothetical protein LOD99_2481 [Oopsacas minuta]|uniref:MYND-type domain-containing protein n=1 Tax=Oopsacas minuta TaxID=111878 RepID=A0AAV7K1T0_9METZ|nr:hypothetical protein LOD99_2481 [Oopsacas minuta]
MASVQFTHLEDLAPSGDMPTSPDNLMSVSKLEELCKREREITDPTAISFLLKSDPSIVDLRDKDGMTLLMHTSYHGNLNMTRLLIEHGASVNLMSRPAYYTPLMFAGIGNHTELCHLLLSSGAKTGITNSIDKNAAEMSSFVGSKECARIISSFFSKENFLSIASRFRLPDIVSSNLYTILLELNNIHPVHALIAIRNFPATLEHISDVINTLEAICDKTFKDTYEEIAFRAHFIRCLYKTIHELEIGEKIITPCELLIKKFLRVSVNVEGSSQMPIQIGMENYLRQAIRSFPFRDMPLYQQTLACLQTIESDEKLKYQLTSPTLHVINSVIRGPLAGRTTMDPICATCGRQGSCLRECTSCKSLWYCGKDCQKLHWFTHKKICSSKCSPEHEQ